ncbi:MAG: hypothetical protein J6M60_01555 [Clostridia bacterium]|nr:hypothetical protein [Clostridia bacterium]
MLNGANIEGQGVRPVIFIPSDTPLDIAEEVWKIGKIENGEYESYKIGDEVKVGTESFYVLKQSGTTESTVTLLAKYNLNKTENEQGHYMQLKDAYYSDTGCIFSNDNYWVSDWESGKRIDLNNYPVPSTETKATSAILKARDYAEALGGIEGRLLTYEEADTLKDEYGDMIWGKANWQEEYDIPFYNYLYYWVSTSNENLDNYVWAVNGEQTEFDGNSHDRKEKYNGVRPVITIEKSKVKHTIGNTSVTDYGQYVDLGTNILDRTIELEDGTTPKSDWRVFKKESKGVWLILADYMPNSAFDVTTVGLEKSDNNYSGTDYSEYGVRVTTNRTDLINGLNNSNWNNLLVGSNVEGVSGVQVKGGATTEDWVESWNANSGYTTLYTAKTASAMSDGLYGVYVGREENPTNNNFRLDWSDPEGFNNTLYFPHNRMFNRIEDYWTSSPSPIQNDGINCFGGGGQGSVWDIPYFCLEAAVRPVVFLPSDIGVDINEDVWKIEKTENKSYATYSLATKVNVGDYVAYDATNNYSYESVKGTGVSHGNGDSSKTFTSSSNIKWRVLSKNTTTGEVVLISETPIGELTLHGAIGYLYAEEEINRVCSIYGHGAGANTDKSFTCQTGEEIEGYSNVSLTGSGARSINVDDINSICRVTPSTALERYYGTKPYTHTIYYPTKTTSNGNSTSATSRSETHTYYTYNGADYLKDTSGELYKMLFRDTKNSYNIEYWLASRCARSSSSDAYFGVRIVNIADDVNIGDVYYNSLCVGVSSHLREYSERLWYTPCSLSTIYTKNTWKRCFRCMDYKLKDSTMVLLIYINYIKNTNIQNVGIFLFFA